MLQRYEKKHIIHRLAQIFCIFAAKKKKKDEGQYHYSERRHGLHHLII